MVTPGGVDAHVHLDQKKLNTGGKSADSFESGSRSAICGGTTTIITFAMQDDPSLLKTWGDYVALASNRTYCDYATHMIIRKPDNDILDSELPILLADHGVSSVKVFMTYKAMMLRDNELLDVMIRCRRYGITTLVHAENGDMIDWLVDRLEEDGKTAPYFHGMSRPPFIETEATSRALAIAGLIDSPILFVHMSAPSAVSVVRNASTEGWPVFAETCPQYLFLTENNMKSGAHDPFEGAKCVCSPPPRKDSCDLEAIWNGLRNGTFTILSSDHAPSLYDSPEGKKTAFHSSSDGRFRYIPNGVPGVETRMPLLFNLGVESGRLSIEKFVELLCTNPAKMYGMYPQKGTLMPGVSDADLCIWYPKGAMDRFKLTNEHLHHDVDYSPYEGMLLGNWPRFTLLRGEIVWKEGKIVGKKGFGRYVKRGKSRIAYPANKWLSDWRPSAKYDTVTRE